jgi:uncharacterized protein YbaA (DUF1428 family)
MPCILIGQILHHIVMSKLDTAEKEKGFGGVVQHIMYRVLKKNHDKMLQLCKEANDMFRENGGQHYDVFQLSNSDVPMNGFTNIANVISADQDEEVWVELLYYRDRLHMNEVIAKMQNDERCEKSYKQSMDLLTPGTSFIMGEFSRLRI